MKIASAFVCLCFAATAFGAAGFSSQTGKPDDTVLRTGKGPHFIGAADVNHDGRPDIVVCNGDDGTISIFLQDSRGSFDLAPGSPFAAGPQPNDIGFGDFDGDGNLDLAIPNHQSPYISIFLGDGHGRFRAAPKSPFKTDSYPHPHGVALGDFNGDGKLDVMSDSWGHDKIEMFLGDGRGNLELPGKTFAVGKRPSSVFVPPTSIRMGARTLSPPISTMARLAFCWATGEAVFKTPPARHFLRAKRRGPSRYPISIATAISISSRFLTRQA